MTQTYILERKQRIRRSRGEVFAFFSDAFNLERLTPPFLRFRILTPPPIEMREGLVIEYRLALLGVPFYWRTLIESYVPEFAFIDRQLKGPYALWRHTHAFEAQGPRQVLMRDRIEYRVPFGWLGRIVHRLFIKRSLKKIFDYRAEMTARLLCAENAEEESLEQHRALAD